jgi:hypothetical protein
MSLESEEIKEIEELEEMEERILFCGTYDEYYFIIIDKIDNNYKINICNEYVYFIDNIYDVSREFLKYVKIIIESLYKKLNKSNILYENLMILNKTNIKESNIILKYLKNHNLFVCKSNLFDTYIYNKFVAKCNFKKYNFIITANIIYKIQNEYKITLINK